MSALGTVTLLPSLRRYSTSICATTVSPTSYTFVMWWVRPSMVEKNPATASLTAARPVTGSALAKRNFASGVRWATNLSGSNASMSAKTWVTSRLMVLSLVGDRRAGTRVASGEASGTGPGRKCMQLKVYAVCREKGNGLGSGLRLGVGQEGGRGRCAPQVRRDFPVVGHPAVVDLVDVGEPLDPGAPGVRV